MRIAAEIQNGSDVSHGEGLKNIIPSNVIDFRTRLEFLL